MNNFACNWLNSSIISSILIRKMKWPNIGPRGISTFNATPSTCSTKLDRLRAKKGPAPPPPREFCRHILS